MNYLLAALCSFFFLALTYSSAVEEFTSVDVVSITSLLAAALGLQISVAHFSTRSVQLRNLILAVFTTLNILYLNLVLNELFLDLPNYGKMVALLVALFCVNTFMTMVTESPRLAKILPALFAFAIATVPIEMFLSAAPAPAVQSEPGKTASKRIQFVDFKTTPNVYLIAFDSLIPRTLAKKHLGIEGAAYHEVLDAHFRRFPNFFADGSRTKPSLNSLLALDPIYYNDPELKRSNNGFFTGTTPSPLFQIFKHNGYETTTLYRSFYFGNKKGPYVDNYQVNAFFLDNGVCEFIDLESWWKRPTLLGYCTLLKSWPVRSTFINLGVVEPRIEEDDYLIDHIRAGLESGAPQVFLAYLWSPGHTITATFDRKAYGALDDYRKQYIRNSETTASQINKIVTFIATKDPGAIIYLFGDHGPWISRRDTFDEDNTFFIQDRFGVYGGIFPPDRCAEYFDATHVHQFMTISQGARHIIRCLSGGQDAFTTSVDYRLPFHMTKGRDRYEDYLYE